MRKQNLISVILVISLVLSVYLVSAKFVMFNEHFYQKEFYKNKIAVKDAYEISKDITGFFNDKTELPSVFDAKEASHMQDVKNVVNKGEDFLIFLCLLNIVLISFLIFYADDKTKALSKTFIFSGIFGLFLPLISVFFSFSNLFEKFHLIFFPQGNWMFPSSSLLIQLFPSQFFYDALITIVINSSIVFFIWLTLGSISSKISSN
jgi:integral membrane protein (TIGR01906 family)